MDVLHGVHDEASSAISSVLPTETSVEMLSLLDYTVYLTFSSGSFRRLTGINSLLENRGLQASR